MKKFVFFNPRVLKTRKGFMYRGFLLNDDSVQRIVPHSLSRKLS